MWWMCFCSTHKVAALLKADEISENLQTYKENQGNKAEKRLDYTQQAPQVFWQMPSWDGESPKERLSSATGHEYALFGSFQIN